MKKLMTTLLIVLAVSAHAQRKGVYTDLLLDKLQFTDLQNAPLKADKLEVGKITKIHFKVANINMDNAVPVGTCRLRLTLGTSAFLTTDLQGNDAPLADYFRWTQSTDPFNQVIVTGDLIRNLPAGFSGEAVFSMMPSKEGQSSITGHFLVTNHKNPLFILSDLDASNNIIVSDYSNLQPLSTKFNDFKAIARSCNLDLNWQVSDENKLTGFVIETAPDGMNFTPLKTIPANGTRNYSLKLENITGSHLDIRIKAEAQTGQFVYSAPVAVNNICNGRFEIALYPNPVTGDVAELKLVAKEGTFNGKYNIRLLDSDGKEISRKDVQLINQDQVKYPIGFLTGGSYQLSVTGADGVTRNLRFVRQ